jgi:hypothetical protein
MKEFSAFPSTYVEKPNGEIDPSYQPGNGNQPVYPHPYGAEQQSCDFGLPGVSTEESEGDSWQTLPVRPDDDRSGDGGTFQIAPPAPGFEEVYDAGLDSAREALHKSE